MLSLVSQTLQKIQIKLKNLQKKLYASAFNLIIEPMLE